MKRKIIIIVLIVSLALNIGVILSFGRHWMLKREFRKGPEGENSWIKNRIKKELNLTDEQVKVMEQDRLELRQLTAPIKDDLRKKRAQLFTLLNDDKVDNAKVDKLIDEISLLQAKVEKTVINHLSSMRKNLTPEQRSRFRSFMQKGLPGMPPEGMSRDMDRDKQ
jgi:Spy/CpxP family protein refolding chaperone